uniref:Leiomodin-3 n=1 Tax=Sinocyclocheilus anshuiensis TaxID=1608454 RepID=A0A671NRX0_9TELE
MKINFGYHKQLGKYEDIDEDELLASLTNEEIQELEKVMAEIEPDTNIPTGLRQEDQTAKQPTGTFCREALLKYWENETHRLLERLLGTQNFQLHHEDWATGGDGEKEARSSNWNFVDLSRLDCKRNGNSGQKPKGIHKGALHHQVTPERPSGNPTDIVKTLENILSNDTSLNEVNLNNIENISQEVLVSFADALISNTHVEVFSLANTHADDQVAFALAEMLKKNCSITNLNVESNFISGKGILALIGSVQYNTTLVELRFHNQRHICGGQVEMEMVKLLRDNTTLLKLGYHFDLPGPRMSATGILTRNQDLPLRRKDERKSLGGTQGSTRDDLLAAIRRSSIGTLRRARHLTFVQDMTK